MNPRDLAKRCVQAACLGAALVPWLWCRLWSPLLGPERAFAGVSQLLALWPGLSGSLLRAAFYRLALPDSSQDTVIAFLTSFSDPRANLGPHVSIGACCNIGRAAIGADSQLGSHVCIASGNRQHGLDSGDPIRLQAGRKDPVRLGPDCWIGNGAVILADVGQGAVVAAGAVVTHPVEPYSIVAGVPARSIGSRQSFSNGAPPCAPASCN